MLKRIPTTFSLRTLIFTFFVSCTAFALFFERVHRQEIVIRKLYSLGNTIQFSDKTYYEPTASSPYWFPPYRSVETVWLRPTNYNPADRQIEIATKLPILQNLIVESGSTIKGQTLFVETGEGAVTDVGLELIGNRLSHVKRIDIYGGNCKPADIEKFSNSLKDTDTKIEFHSYLEQPELR